MFCSVKGPAAMSNLIVFHPSKHGQHDWDKKRQEEQNYEWVVESERGVESCFNTDRVPLSEVVTLWLRSGMECHCVRDCFILLL